jgi:hypothetical protein
MTEGSFVKLQKPFRMETIVHTVKRLTSGVRSGGA